MRQDTPLLSPHFQTSRLLAHRCSASALLSYAGGKNDIWAGGKMAMTLAPRLCTRHKMGPRKCNSYVLPTHLQSPRAETKIIFQEAVLDYVGEHCNSGWIQKHFLSILVLHFISLKCSFKMKAAVVQWVGDSLDERLDSTE